MSKKDWKKVQENTFTKWVNNSLKGHLTSGKSKVTSLETDLADGIILGELLECLTKEKFRYAKESKQLRIKPQRVENIGASFKFMDEKGIKLVNIGPEDIYNENLKLILGLIWTLIRRFQIRSTGRGLSTKDAMLAWINTQIPEQKIQNFTTDWNNGIALCALVNRIRPGLIPHFATLNGANKRENCTLGMKTAEEKLDIPFLMEPDDLAHPDVDEISVMTYISYFTKLANAHLLHYIQATIPNRKITNFTSDWNNGVNLACLLDALNPGGFSDWNSLDPHNALDNLSRGMNAAKEQLGIEPVLKPSQMADPSVDELNIVTYLSRFKNAKPLPQPQAIVCKGEGLSKAIVGTPAVFEIDTSRGGVGDLAVTISCGGNSLSADMQKKGNGIFKVQYIPESGGKLAIVIKWSGTEIPSSPYSFTVINPSAFSLSSKELTGKECAKVGETVTMELKGFSSVSEVDLTVELSTKKTEKASIVQTSNGVAKCSYTPRQAGVDKVVAKIGGIKVPGSPFNVKVIDPSAISVTLKEPKMHEPLLVNHKATFVVSSKASMEAVKAEFVTPKGPQSVSLSPQGASSSVGVVTPVTSGLHEVRVTCGGDAVSGSPISISVYDPSKCCFKDSLPKFLHVGKPFSIALSTDGAGEGKIEATTSDLGILTAEMDAKLKKDLSIHLNPKKVGNTLLRVTWNGADIPQCPHSISVCDASKCSAFGPGLTSGKGKINETFKFKVQVKGSGNGELCVTPKGPRTVYAADISKASGDTYDVSFTTFELGVHTIDITWSDEPIPNSPYKVNFEKAISPSAFTVTGEGLKTAIALTPANIMIVGPESGLLADGKLRISVSGMGLSSTTVGSRAEFESSTGKPMVFVTDKGNGAYPAEYCLPKAGKYTITITADGGDVPGSPFQVQALPEASAEACTVFGPAIDNPNNLIVNKPIEFKVDSTDAGTGELSVSAVDKNSVAVPVFLADDKRQAGKRIHAVKIDPSSQGTVTVHVRWAGKDIPKSPLSFEVNNPKSVVIIDLPESGDYIGRKGEEFSFSVDTRPAGSKGELKAAAKLDNGKVEPFRLQQNPDGTNKLLFTPTSEGRVELLLTYCGANILKAPWACDVTDPSAFKVAIPKGPSKKGEQVKFSITGLTPKLSKNITVTAKNNGHDATTKITFEQQRIAMVHFTAKEIGEYDVVVKAAKKHVTGSPFKCVVVDPTACTIKGEFPSVLVVGDEKTFAVDVSKAGPGSLEFDCVGSDGITNNAILSKISGGKEKSVGLEGASCGAYTCSLKFAGFYIPGMPKEIMCTDPTKCSFTCDGIRDYRCKTTSNITINVDTTEGGCCSPTIIAHGPKSKYDLAVKKTIGGRYSATVTPWQEGSNTIEVMVGGMDLSGSPVNFESLKPVDSSKITVSGPGLHEAVVNRPAQVIIHARESRLIDQGVLEVMLPGCDLEVKDQLNGSYAVLFVPKASGSLSMQVTGEGKAIPGSPFNINVKPEPDASKCIVKDRSGKEIFRDSREIHHLVRTPFEVGVYTSEAGSGSLTASGLDPSKSRLQLFTSEATEKGEKVSYIKFDPLSVGTYSLSICWDGKELLGSPYKICVVDPSKCVFNTEFPSYIRKGEDISLEVDTSKAGEGVVEAYSSGREVKSNVIKNMGGVFMIVLSGAQLGDTSIHVKFGGFGISDSSYPISVCDPTKCTFDFEPGTYNVGKDFNINFRSTGAGNAKLRVDSSKKCSTKVRNLYGSNWEINVTPKEVGDHLLNIFWGDWEIKGSPVSFFACDPNQIQIIGLPKPSEILILDVPISFWLDHSKAGAGSITCQAQYSDGEEVNVEREETDGGVEKSMLSFIPRKPGKMKIILEYNNVSILPGLYEYNVPDPSSFSVVPPKGYGKIKEYVKFGITGVKDESDITITANHPEHPATVKTERSPADLTVLARFTPKQTGDYTVEVKLADQHIEGSPFVVQVANPDAVKTIGKMVTVVHTGDEPNLKFDVSKAGPGELTFETEVVSGTEDPEAEKKSSWLVPLVDGVGKLKVVTKWAGYDIQGSPFIIACVDSHKVTWSCNVLENSDILKQGQLVNINLDCTAAGDAIPEVTARGPEGEYPTSVKDNEDGTFTVTLTPWQIGSNEVEILWGGKPIDPIKFEVMKNIDAKGITASGDGLTKAIAKSECCITLNGIESGLLERGLLQAYFENEEKENVPPIEMTDEGSGIYLLRFTPTSPEVHTLVIKYEGNDIVNSPFSIPVLPAPDSDCCKAVGEAIEKDPAVFVANDPVKFTIDTTEAGTGMLSVSAVQPNDEPIRVYTVEEGGLHHLKFDPTIIGCYSVEVRWCNIDIPGSPFTFSVVDPSKCRVTGVPPESTPVQANEKFTFSVDTKDVGDCTLCLQVKSEGATIAQETVESDDSSNGLLAYTFEHDTVGKTTLDVLIAGVHVPGSPFPINIVDSTQFFIAGTNIEDEYAIVCEPVEISVQGKPSEDDEDEELIVVAHGPSADLNVDVANKGEAGYMASFVPIEPGSYEVFVEFARRHVRGSPLTIKVADPSKCQILGRAPSVVHVGSREEITVKTRGAGEGRLEAAPVNEDEYMSVEMRDLGLDTYIVVLTGENIGTGSVALKWGGYDIPKCPLQVSICDASKCKAVGGALATKKGKAGSVVSFIVETAGAGKAKLEVSAKGPSAQYTVSLVEKEDGKYEASFTPWEIGEHTVNVQWGRAHIPESPFSLNIGSPLEMEVCNATGDGLENAIAGRKATFTVLSSEVGLLDKNELNVTVMGISAHAPVEIIDNNNGCYTVEYVAPTPGAYVATILFHGRNIPGSPFKLTAAPGPDASKCKVYGPALHPNALAIAGSPLEFFVDTAEAGHGELKVYIQGPNDYRPKVFMADDDQGVYSIKFDAMKAGKYFAVIVWSDQHIPKSPLKLRVHPAADASKVRAFGPGLIDGFIGAPGQFTIETKNAGIGTLLIRVHGLKDSFKIEARPLSEDDSRTLISTYNPKLVGEYTIFVRWSGVHVPGSPFTVKIKQKPGVHDPSVEPPKKVKSKKRHSSTSSRDKKVVPEPPLAKAVPPDFDASQEKRKRGRPSSTTSSKMSGAPQKTRPASTAMVPSPAVGPIAPSMKMRDNPAMAMALPQSSSQEPGGYVSGIVQGENSYQYSQTRVTKKVVKKVIQKKKVAGRSSRSQSKKQTTSERPQRALSPGAVEVGGVRKSRTTSPKPTTKVPAPQQAKPSSGFFSRQTKVTQQKVTSPERKPAPPVAKAPSSDTREATSQQIPEVSRPETEVLPKPTVAAQPPPQTEKSPERKALSPAHKASAHKAKSPVRKAVSPRRKAVPASRKARSPTPKAVPPAAKALSPARKAVPASRKAQSPTPKAAPPAAKALSPARKAVPASQKAQSPTPKAAPPAAKAQSPARKAMSPGPTAKLPVQTATSPPKATTPTSEVVPPLPSAPPKMDSAGQNAALVHAVHAVPVVIALPKSESTQEESAPKDKPHDSAAVPPESQERPKSTSLQAGDVPVSAQGATSGPSRGPSTKPTSPTRRVTSPPRKAAGRRVRSPPPRKAAASPVPKGGPKKKADPSRTKSPLRRPPPKGKNPPPKKSAKKKL